MFLLVCGIAACRMKLPEASPDTVVTAPDPAPEAITDETVTTQKGLDMSIYIPDEENMFSDYIHYRAPLLHTFRRLTEDRELTVVYFGGSVTGGYGASNEKYCWRSLIGKWICSEFSKANIRNVNRACGESGTCLGTYRLQMDVIPVHPDLVFVEYSINDYYYKSTYGANQIAVSIRQRRFNRRDLYA